MRNPKKGGKKKGAPAAAAAAAAAAAVLEPPAAADDAPGGAPAVWRPGVDPLAEDEELAYDATAYDCLHRFALDWPCLSFDLLRDDLGGPRTTFPHTVFMVAGTQADAPRSNYLAVLRLTDLGQGRHGKRADKKAARKKAGGGEDSDDSDDSMDEDDDDEESSSSEGEDSDAEAAGGGGGGGGGGAGREPPPKMHHRLVGLNCGVNRVRSCPQQPGVVALWCENGSVRVLDVAEQLAALAREAEAATKAASRVSLNPLQTHAHAAEGFAVDWSRVKAGRLATGDCHKHIHVWEPAEGGRWTVSAPYNGHTGSVEDLQWSPSEETVFASCSTDRTVAVFDTRERARAMLRVAASDAADVNVIAWNGLVHYMLASGDDAGALRVWDLRSFKDGGCVSAFNFHRGAVTSVEWSPYESSMLASSGADDQVAVWDLALEADPEEEAALAPEGNAVPQEPLPSQLLFVHAGQRDVKELHWHAQIPGLIGTTAADGLNLFRPSNL